MLANFLDRETAKIDALVAEQEKLIALLKEKRQAVISHAVTKGLDRMVLMKDSAVEWFGKVPVHWIVNTVRRVISSIEQGWSPECDASPAGTDEWGVLKAGCVNRGRFDPDENKTLPMNAKVPQELEILAGDILMSRASGSPELVGSTAMVGAGVRRKLLLSDKIFRVRVSPFIEPTFFVAAFNSRALRSQIEQALSGGNGLANNLPQSSLFGFTFCLPPIAEQQGICDHIRRTLGEIDSLTTTALNSIALFQERRTALISAAVTGQIDVRAVIAEASIAGFRGAGPGGTVDALLADRRADTAAETPGR